MNPLAYILSRQKYPCQKKPNTPSLFDINQDPQQKNDLYTKFPELVKKIQAREHSFLQLVTEMTAKKKERRD